MKKLIMLVAVLFMVPSAVCAVEVLDEKMPVVDWNANYVPARDAGHEASNAGNYPTAIGHYKKAGNSTAFKYVRAINWVNVAFCYMQNAHKVTSRSDAKDARIYYTEALALLDEADGICSTECVHETNCTAKRVACRGRAVRGLKAANKYLKR